MRYFLATILICSLGIPAASALPAARANSLSASRAEPVTQAAARNRSFTPTTSFWAWIDQLLDANSSCSKAVSRVQTWCAENNRTVPSSATGAYCLARQRLGSDFLAQIHQNLTHAAGSRRRSCDLWRGFVPKAIDGSSVQLLDTPENQQRFPQSSSQQPGCGFPIMAIAGVLDLYTGAWLGMTTGPGPHPRYQTGSKTAGAL